MSLMDRCRGLTCLLVAVSLLVAVVRTEEDENSGCKQHFLDQIVEEYTMCIRFLDPEKLLTTKFGNIAEGCRYIVSNMTHCNVHFKGSLDNCVNDAQKYSALLLSSKELAHGYYLCRENGKYITEFWNKKGPECLKSLPLNQCNSQRKFHHYQDGSFCRSMISEMECLKGHLSASVSCQEPVKQLLIGTLEAGLNATACDTYFNELTDAAEIKTPPFCLLTLLSFFVFALSFL